MSLTSAMSNALSGLTAAGRGADVVASNVANALTEGYARRELALSARQVGGQGAGVAVDGVTRAVNQTVLNDKRLAAAAAANAELRSAARSRFEARLGAPGEPDSLSGRIVALETALTLAASRPDSEARLQAVLTALGGVTGKLQDLESDLQHSRAEADAQIGREVAVLNDSLGQIEGLNLRIVAERAAGRDASALFDQRQALVDRISTIVPIREVAREREQIALFTTGGAILLEGRPVRIGFAPTGTIAADMTRASGALSGLTLNGQSIPPTDPGLIGGGSLAAAFALRDEIAPAAQAQIDALARDLVARFEAPSADPTRPAGAAGLLTDAQGTLDPAAETGLAGRIDINLAADPLRGGALWRLRDGLGAAAPGPAGEARGLQALATALSAPHVPASGDFLAAARSAAGLATDVLSQASSARLRDEARASYAGAQRDSLIAQHLQDGVDSDAEMQRLMVIEQAFSANARVLSTLDDLIQQLIRL